MENTKASASRTFVSRGNDGKAKFSVLQNPAIVTYYGLIYVVKHTPVLEIVPGICPESYFNKEMEGGMRGYQSFCEKFYRDVEEEFVHPALSWNKGDIIPFSTARVTDDWVDASVDGGWRYIRAPRANVVLMCPNPAIDHTDKSIMSYESFLLRAV